MLANGPDQVIPPRPGELGRGVGNIKDTELPHRFLRREPRIKSGDLYRWGDRMCREAGCLASSGPKITLPIRRADFGGALHGLALWLDQHRPYTTLKGTTSRCQIPDAGADRRSTLPDFLHHF